MHHAVTTDRPAVAKHLVPAACRAEGVALRVEFVSTAGPSGGGVRHFSTATRVGHARPRRRDSVTTELRPCFERRITAALRTPGGGAADLSRHTPLRHAAQLTRRVVHLATATCEVFDTARRPVGVVALAEV